MEAVEQSHHLSTRWCDAHALPHELTYGRNDLIISVVHLCLPNPGGHGQASSCSHIPHTAALSPGPLSFFPLLFQPYPLARIPLGSGPAVLRAQTRIRCRYRVCFRAQRIMQPPRVLVPVPSTFSWSVETQLLLQNRWFSLYFAVSCSQKPIPMLHDADLLRKFAEFCKVVAIGLQVFSDSVTDSEHSDTDTADSDTDSSRF